MARHYGIPKQHRPNNRLERLRGSRASPERTDQEQPAQSSHSEYRYKMILEFIGWFAFMLMMATVCITFG